MARFIYTLVFTLLMPLILVRLYLRARKAPEYGKHLGQRFGLFTGPKKRNAKQGGIWFHTVSVGEFIAAAPLIEQTLHAYPNELITITTTTPTGSEQVKKRFAHQLGKQVFHVYLPYDLPWFLYGFLYKVQPRLLVILETELWPNLIHCANKVGCYTMVVNARLSEKSAKGYAKVGSLTRDMLQKIDVLAVQNENDAQRFLTLGMPEQNMQVTGSIKFDLTISSDLVAQGKAIRQSWGETRPVVIVASTHQGEDEIAIDAFSKLKQSHPNLLMIIVPRHPERFETVAGLIKQQGFNFARRSLHDTSSETEVFLLDSMGELMPFLAASDVCVMGGSFVENGGHNPLEPAALSIPVVMGKSQFNFALICQQLEQAGGLVSVSEEELSQQLAAWLAEPQSAQAAGQAAQEVVAQNRGAKQKVAELIESAMKKIKG